MIVSLVESVPGLPDALAPLHEFGIAVRRIGIPIAGLVTAAAEINLMPVARFFVVKTDPRADVTHGIAAPPLVAQVGFAPVDEAAIVQARVIRFQHAGHGL